MSDLLRRLRFWFWGELFVHSKPLGRRATRWLYIRHRAAAPPVTRSECWFCKRDVAYDDLIAGYDTFKEQRLACSVCDRRMTASSDRDA